MSLIPFTSIKTLLLGPLADFCLWSLSKRDDLLVTEVRMLCMRGSDNGE